VGDPSALIDPDRDSDMTLGSIPLLRPHGVVSVGDQPDLDAPLLAPDRRFNDPGACCQGVESGEKPLHGGVDCVRGEGGAVFLWNEPPFASWVNASPTGNLRG
jgi:hypothetical protein